MVASAGTIGCCVDLIVCMIAKQGVSSSRGIQLGKLVETLPIFLLLSPPAPMPIWLRWEKPILDTGSFPPCTVRLRFGLKAKRPSSRRGALRQNCSFLEQIPEELVVDFVMELDFLRLHEGSQSAGATVGGGFLQISIAALYIFP